MGRGGIGETRIDPRAVAQLTQLAFQLHQLPGHRGNHFALLGHRAIQRIQQILKKGQPGLQIGHGFIHGHGASMPQSLGKANAWTKKGPTLNRIDPFFRCCFYWPEAAGAAGAAGGAGGGP